MTEIDARLATHLAAGLHGVDVDDEFDLDLRLGELAAWHPRHPMADAQTDGAGCLPTDGRGGGTCNTQDNTCPGTCAGHDTCPHTACDTCQATCAGHHTCDATCNHTDCGATCNHTDCGPTCLGGHTHCECHTVGLHCSGNPNCTVP